MIVASAAGTAIAMGVAGIVAVVAISAVFYAIGRGEDRERAAAATPEEPAGDATEGPPAEPHATRPRLSTSRRRRRGP